MSIFMFIALAIDVKASPGNDICGCATLSFSLIFTHFTETSIRLSNPLTVAFGQDVVPFTYDFIKVRQGDVGGGGEGSENDDRSLLKV